MYADDFDELAGRIEGVARMMMHLVARLEDDGKIDGPAFVRGLRGSVVITDDSGRLMQAAKRTLDNTARALDDAREWRRFRAKIAG
jgi:hypothetical protein